MSHVVPCMIALLLTMTSFGPARADDAEDKVIALVEKLGGRMTRAEDRPGKPVVRVSLYCRDLTGVDLKQLAAFKELTSLVLAWSTVTDADLKAVSALAGLTALDLHTTEVTDAGLKVLARLKNLTALNLNFTKITDAGLKGLAALPNLTSLKLKDTKVTDDGVKEFQKALPKCKIER